MENMSLIYIYIFIYNLNNKIFDLNTVKFIILIKLYTLKNKTIKVIIFIFK